MLRAKDEVVHARALTENLTLLSKTKIFEHWSTVLGRRQSSFLFGFGNVPIQAIAEALITRRAEIATFLGEVERGVFEIARG